MKEVNAQRYEAKKYPQQIGGLLGDTVLWDDICLFVWFRGLSVISPLLKSPCLNNYLRFLMSFQRTLWSLSLSYSTARYEALAQEWWFPLHKVRKVYGGPASAHLEVLLLQFPEQHSPPLKQGEPFCLHDWVDWVGWGFPPPPMAHGGVPPQIA